MFSAQFNTYRSALIPLCPSCRSGTCTAWHSFDCFVTCQGLGSFRKRDFMQEDCEHSDSQDSDNSSQSPGTRSSRMRRATFPVDDEDVPSQGESSRESSPRSHSPSPRRIPDSPPRPPLAPARSVRSPLHPFEDLFEGQPQKADQPPLSGDQDGQQQRAATSPSGHEQQQGHNRHQSGSPKAMPERRKSVDDGFNSDPDQSSRPKRLQVTHLSKSENSHMPGVPRPKGIRRVASECQLLSKYAGRAGTGQKLGSFGSHTSDCTSSFDAYLRHHRNPSPSPKCRQGFLLPASIQSCVLLGELCCVSLQEKTPRKQGLTEHALWYIGASLFWFSCSGVIASFDIIFSCFV